MFSKLIVLGVFFVQTLNITLMSQCWYSVGTVLCEHCTLVGPQCSHNVQATLSHHFGNIENYIIWQCCQNVVVWCDFNIGHQCSPNTA